MPEPPAQNGKTWYASISGEQQGPMTFADLQQLVRSGQLDGRDFVFEEGMSEWVRCNSIQRLEHLVSERTQRVSSKPTESGESNAEIKKKKPLIPGWVWLMAGIAAVKLIRYINQQ